MAAKILIPTPLRAYTDGRSAFEVGAATVGDAIRELTGRFPDLERHLLGEAGELRSYVNLYLGEEDVRRLQGPATPLGDDDTLTIVPAIAGGSVIGETGAETRLEPPEIARYSRHLILPEVGMEGQKRLKSSSVLLIGAGGLGSPLGLYLAAAGVGRIGVVDFDRVDESNLQRQVLYGARDVGRAKIEAATERLSDVNPYVTIQPHETRLTSENALRILADYDIVVDGTDNFPTRYLVNDACVLLGKPNVYGSIFRFEGQASVFWAGRGPCYRCLYPEPPPPGLVPSCAEGGVLGVLPGIVGAIQATETVKLILGRGEPLIGRLLLFNALEMSFRQLRLRPDPGCPVCGEHPTVRELIDYQQFCGLSARDEATDTADAVITPARLKERLDRGERLVLIDVRSPEEWEICHLEQARLIPMGELASRMGELDSRDEIVFVCKIGKRSAKAAELVRGAGFDRARSLEGGLIAWSREIDPSMPVY
jgi:adenylyltransferase/sulfurtransferase